MDQEMTGAFDGIRGDIAREANTTRGSLRDIHKRIDVEKDARQKEAAAHDKESAVRAVQMNNDIANANGKASDAVVKVDRHTTWHSEQEKLQKSEKRQGKGMWVAIAIAIMGWIITVLKDCGGSF